MVNLSELEILTGFSKSQPHAAYSALTKGLLSNWSYVIRTTSNISNLLQPLEDLIRMKLIPALIDRPPPNDIERSLLSLPTRHGDMAITNPVETSDDIYSASTKISNPLKLAIVMAWVSVNTHITYLFLKFLLRLKFKSKEGNRLLRHLKM